MIREHNSVSRKKYQTVSIQLFGIIADTIDLAVVALKEGKIEEFKRVYENDPFEVLTNQSRLIREYIK